MEESKHVDKMGKAKKTTVTGIRYGKTATWPPLRCRRRRRSI